LQNPYLDPGPRFYEGGDIGVLLLHGYTATPVEVSLLAEYLHTQAGYTVVCPLLPGHGTKIDDLHKIKWQHWADHVENIYEQLSKKCTFRFVGGTSLGGLLALYLAVFHPEIKGLLIYSPALIVNNRMAILSHELKYFVKTIPKFRKKVGQSIVEERWQGYTSDSLPAISQLLRLQQVVRKNLPRITQPILICQGMRDETINPKGASEIYRQVRSKDKKLHYMEESTHSLLLDQEWEKIAQETVAFISHFEL
jgi:carboxylesterase